MSTSSAVHGLGCKLIVQVGVGSMGSNYVRKVEYI